MLTCLRRWLPDRELVVVADQAYAALRLLVACRRLSIVAVVRLRLDAALYDPPPPRRAGQRGRPRIKGARQPSLRQRLADPGTVWTTVRVRWYDSRRKCLAYATGTALWYHSGQPVVLLRWVLLRDPAGTRAPWPCSAPIRSAGPTRSWPGSCAAGRSRSPSRPCAPTWAARSSASGRLRPSPALLGLFSWVTVTVHVLLRGRRLPPRRTAWYPKTAPTFAEALVLVRATLWTGQPPFPLSRPPPNMPKPPPLAPEHLWDFLCYTA